MLHTKLIYKVNYINLIFRLNLLMNNLHKGKCNPCLEFCKHDAIIINQR